MKRVLALDITGLHALEEFEADLRFHGTQFLIAGAHTQPLMTMSRAGFVEHLGEVNFCADMDTAIARARALLEDPQPPDESDLASRSRSPV